MTWWSPALQHDKADHGGADLDAVCLLSYQLVFYDDVTTSNCTRSSNCDLPIIKRLTIQISFNGCYDFYGGWIIIFKRARSRKKKSQIQRCEKE